MSTTDETNFSRSYQSPRTQMFPLEKRAFNYLTEIRRLNPSVIEDYRLHSGKNNEILIPFYDENDVLRLIKKRSDDGTNVTYRKKDKDSGEWIEISCKTYCEPHGKPVLFGSHLANPELGPLVICFGDYDAMSVASDGVPNCVSPPYGDKSFRFVTEQFDWLETFKTIILYPDIDANPKTRKQVEGKVFELAKKLERHRVKVVLEKFRYGTKDASELLQLKGPGANRYLIDHAEFIKEPGLEFLADYREVPIKEGTPLGWSDIDAATGGLGGSQLSIFGGDNNAGKTTTILNIVKSFVKQRKGVFYWSGEQKPDKIRWWFEQICAGPQYIQSTMSPRTGREYFHAANEHIQRIRAWYRPYVHVLDKRGIEAEEFFETCELVVRRYDIGLILVDNLMAFTNHESEYFASQAAFVESGKNFAEDWDVHFGIVAHNKKIEFGVIPDKDAVEGSKKITNWADYVYQIIRVTSALEQKIPAFEGANSIISLCKNRETETLVDVRMTFDSRSKRLAQMTEQDKIDERLGWEPIDDSINGVLEIENDELGF
jgi:hypothetical protein